MTSKIVVNNIESDTGVSTVTIASPVALSGGITGTGFAVGTGASISSPATNILTVSTNNAERIRVGAAGSIGIGTDNPLGVLAVSGGVSNPAITFQNGSATNTASDAAVGSIVGYSRTTGGNINIGSVDIRTDTASASSGAVRILTASNGSLAERLRVDSNGRVTMPYQPHAEGGVTGLSNTTVTTGAHIFTYNSPIVNIGNHYDASQYRFNCPVSGNYLVKAHAQTNGQTATTANTVNFNIRKNGASVSGAYESRYYGGTAPGYVKLEIVDVVYATAGDYLDIYAIQSATGLFLEYAAADVRWRFSYTLLG